jgi:hypothetical protein
MLAGTPTIAVLFRDLRDLRDLKDFQRYGYI